MLEGITILNKITEVSSPWWSTLVFIGIFILSTSIGLLLTRKDKDKSLLALFALLGFLLGLVLMIIIDLSVKVPTRDITYQVTIDNNVKFKEFDCKYQIIEQEGDIYYIREK